MIIENTNQELLFILAAVIAAGIVLYLLVSAAIMKAEQKKLERAKKLIMDRHDRINNVKWRVLHEKAINHSDKYYSN